MIQSNTLYASYSILKLWQAGQWEAAVKQYFKLEKFITPAMKAGQDFHTEWQTEIQKTKRLPKVFGGEKLNNPETEKLLDYQIYDWLILRGIVDCLDSPNIHEFKTGKQSSESYTSQKQAGVYGVLCVTKKIFVDKVYIHHYDQYKPVNENNPDVALIHLTDKLLDDTMNWIITVSTEIHNYFLENQLYERYGMNRTR